MRKGLGVWVLVMENMMKNAPNPRRHMKVFQEGLSLDVHYLKLVKFVFMRNAKVSHPLCNKMLIRIQLMEMENKRMLKALMSLKPFLVF